MLKRRTKKLTKSMVRKITGTTYMTCKECNEEEVTVPGDTKAVTCAYCVQKMIAPPPNHRKAEKSDKPRGWHFKAYFEHEGIVYSKGKVVSDKKEIIKLKKSTSAESAPKKTTPKKASKVKSAPVAKKPTVKVKKVAKTTSAVTRSKLLPEATKKATKPSPKRGIKNARTAK